MAAEWSPFRFLAHFLFFCIVLAMTVRMRINRGATGRRRSHHALKGVRLSKCAECGMMKLPHRVCNSCGKYRGRVVIDMVKVAEKKSAKTKARAAANAR